MGAHPTLPSPKGLTPPPTIPEHRLLHSPLSTAAPSVLPSLQPWDLHVDHCLAGPTETPFRTLAGRGSVEKPDVRRGCRLWNATWGCYVEEVREISTMLVRGEHLEWVTGPPARLPVALPQSRATHVAAPPEDSAAGGSCLFSRNKTSHRSECFA